MRGKLAVLVLALVLALAAAAAHAATITITISAAQLTRVTRAFNRTNAKLAAQTPPGVPYADVAAYASARFLSVIQEDLVGYDADDSRNFAVACRAASAGTKDVLCTSLGLAAGCNPCPQ